MDASSAPKLSRVEGQHREHENGPSSPLTPFTVQESEQQLRTDLAYYRLCALTGMPQELVRHPRCGPEKFAAAVTDVLASERRSFYEVLKACLDSRDRAALYKDLQSRNGSSVSDHVHYAELCRMQDRTAVRRAQDSIRSALSFWTRKRSFPPENGVLEDLVNIVLAGFPTTVTREQILICLKHIEQQHYHEELEEADAPVREKRRRSGRRNGKNGNGDTSSVLTPVTAQGEKT